MFGTELIRDMDFSDIYLDRLNVTSISTQRERHSLYENMNICTTLYKIYM
jgi:hypothetical protein